MSELSGNDLCCPRMLTVWMMLLILDRADTDAYECVFTRVIVRCRRMWTNRQVISCFTYMIVSDWYTNRSTYSLYIDYYLSNSQHTGTLPMRKIKRTFTRTIWCLDLFHMQCIVIDTFTLHGFISLDTLLVTIYGRFLLRANTKLMNYEATCYKLIDCNEMCALTHNTDTITMFHNTAYVTRSEPSGVYKIYINQSNLTP